MQRGRRAREKERETGRERERNLATHAHPCTHPKCTHKQKHSLTHTCTGGGHTDTVPSKHDTREQTADAVCAPCNLF